MPLVHNTPASIEDILREYPQLFVTKDDFIHQYTNNDGRITEAFFVEADYLFSHPYNMECMSVYTMNDGYYINVRCNISDKYGIQRLFCSKKVNHDDVTLLSIIRDKKINAITETHPSENP